MYSDENQEIPTTFPEYILPDDPPDLKPDLQLLKVEEEPRDPLALDSPTAADDPASATPGPSVSLDIEEEELSIIMTVDMEEEEVMTVDMEEEEVGDTPEPSGSPDMEEEEPSDTPGLTMTVDVKEEELGADTSSSPGHGSTDKVEVLHATNTPGSARIFDKQNICVFCLEPQSKLARHLIRKHKDEKEVEEATSLPVRSKERKDKFQILLNRGNFKYNTTVLEEGRGVLIPWKRPPSGTANKDMLPCTKCMGFFSRKFLFRHKCHAAKLHPGTSKRHNLQSSARMMLPGCSSVGMKAVMSKMRSDDVSACCRSDELLMEFGAKKFSLLGHEEHQHAYVRDKMRELGRLIVELKKNDPEASVEKYLHHSRFETLTSAVRNITKQDGKTFRVPSLALKLGVSLHECANILHTRGIISGDRNLIECAESFKNIYRKGWKSHVSGRALGTLHEKRWKRPACLPLAEEVQNVHRCIANDIANAQRKLQEAPHISSYSALAEATLAQVALFNRRRPGEASRLSLDVYEKRSSVPNEDIIGQLSPLEQQLCNTIQHVVVRGKKGKRVPVLLTESMAVSLDRLVGMRTTVGISAKCPFIFVKATDDTKPMRESVAIRVFASSAGAQNVTATACRKHVATMMQLLQLKENEEEMVARLLGHDIRFHREYHRLPENTTQVAKVTKLLMTMELGVGSFVGKTLDEVNPSVNDHLDVGDVEVDDPRPEILGDDEGTDSRKRRQIRRQIRSQKAETACEETMHHQETEVQGAEGQTKQRPANATRKERTTKGALDVNRLRPRNPWGEEERAVVKRRLGQCIETLRCPSKSECVAVVGEEPVLRGKRSWRDLKCFVYNTIQKKKR